MCLSFRDFVSAANPKYIWYRHCEMLAAVLQRVADGEIKRLMVFAPPRHGKSELVSRLFSAYYLYRYPHRWVGINSYSAELAFTLSRSARENYTRVGGPHLGDAAAVKHWETGRGGGLWAAGVGGSITGKGWHLGIIDDPLKNAEEAESAQIREKQLDWYGSTFYTREEPCSETDTQGAIVLIQTRWNTADLAGVLLDRELDGEEEAPERWHIVNLEAIKEEELPKFPETCTAEPDWRAPGEALCPERRPLHRLQAISKRIGAYFFGALFQQRPTQRQGGLFNVEKIGFVDRVPPGLRHCRGWDLGATADDGDFTAGVLLAGPDKEGLWYIADVERGQWATDKRNAKMQSAAGLDGLAVKIRLAQDPGQAGVDQRVGLVKMLAGYSVHAQRVSGSKELRADPFSAQVNAGNVRVLRAPWNRAFIDELRVFPRGKNDDQVDAVADAFNELTLGGQPSAPAAGGVRAGLTTYQPR